LTVVEPPAHLPTAFLEMCKRRAGQRKVADSTGAELTGRQLLMRTLILRRLLLREVLADDEPNVGILLPPTCGAVVVNMAALLCRRVAVNLNYSVSSAVMNHCIEQAGIKHVLTSRKFMEKMQFDLNAEIVYLEDLREKLKLSDKLAGLWGARFRSAAALARNMRLDQLTDDDLLTIIFTSGSTGRPKGVMLSYGNIKSNVAGAVQAIRLTPEDTLVGVLPFFHSFGYTLTLWTVMALDVKGAYHFSPLEPRQVGKLCRKYEGTVFLSTPTFLRSYLRRCEPEDFAACDAIITGAESLPADLAAAFEEKFGVRPVEGYGATELSPLVSVNVPPSRVRGEDPVLARDGTVGKPIVGVKAKIIDPETGAELPTGEQGMLLISGSNVMQGYLDMPEQTAEVLRDGWYVTGDMALLDDEGFIRITGRESRFSKIGGEMVPHILIEEALNEAIGLDEDGSLKAVVTAVPDARKGERLVVVHTEIDKTPEELSAALTEAGLPNLFIPGKDAYTQVEELPILGSGKTDLKALKELALERFGGEA